MQDLRAAAKGGKNVAGAGHGLHVVGAVAVALLRDVFG